MYRRVSEFLERHIGQDQELDRTEKIEVLKVLALKIGAIAFSITPPDRISGESSCDITSVSTPSEIFSKVDSLKIKQAIGEHPNVFDIAILNEEPNIGTVSFSGNMFLIRNAVFRFTVNMPERLQKYRSHSYFLQDHGPIESFSVISNGSLFVAYAIVHDAPFLSAFGQEARELIVSQLQRKLDIHAEVVGPSPLHIDVYFVQIKPSSGASKFARTFVASENCIIITISGEDFNVEDLTTSFLKTISGEMLIFYRTELQYTSLLHSHARITQIFSALCDCMQRLLSLPFWRMIKFNRDLKEGRISLSKIHKEIVGFQSATFDYKRQRSFVIDSIRNHSLFSLLEEYFARITKLEFELSSGLYAAISYIDNQFKTWTDRKSMIAASVVGAIVGGVIVLLFR